MAVDTATGTTTTTGGFAQPYQEYVLKEAEKLYGFGAPEYYPGTTYAPFSPEQEMALTLMEERALGGSPVMTAAQDLLEKTLTGGFLGGTPGLEAAIARATEPAQAAAMSSLASRGRLGSGLGGQAVAKSVGDIAADIAYTDYANERARQQAALQLAPSFAQADYYDIGKLGEVGAERQRMTQLGLDEALNRYMYEAEAPWQQLEKLRSVAYGFPGTETTAITPYYTPSKGSTFLGGAMVGSQLGLTGNKWLDALIGGGLGLL